MEREQQDAGETEKGRKGQRPKKERERRSHTESDYFQIMTHL